MGSNTHLRRGSTRSCQRCLFNISRACAGKWILTDIFEVAQRGLQTDSSSSGGIWEPKKSPGSSEAEKLSIPNCFVIVLNTFGSPARFQFFWLLATLQLIDRQRQPCRRFLFNIPVPVQENELPRTPSRRLNTALSKVSDQYSSSPCRKMDSNRHLRSGLARPCRRCPFNIPRACARKRTLRDTRQTNRQLQTDTWDQKF